jgi:hypothetical protein
LCELPVRYNAEAALNKRGPHDLSRHSS